MENTEKNTTELQSNQIEAEEEVSFDSTASFEESVYEFDVKKIQPVYSGKKRGIFTTMFVVRLFLLVLCSAMFMYCAYSIAERVYENIQSERMIASMADAVREKPAVDRLMPAKTSEPSLTLYDSLGVIEHKNEWAEIEVTNKYDSIRNIIAEEKAKNFDVYGWIRVLGSMTQINYMMVRGDNNQFYLKHDINKNQNTHGSIFIDYRNSAKHSDNLNTVIYGHCMTDGTMFRPLKEWFDSTSVRNSTAANVKIEIITLDAVYIYDLFSTYRSDDASSYAKMSFQSSSAFKKHLLTLQKNSRVSLKRTPNDNDRIITLITCTNSTNEDERYILHGILAKIIKYE